MWRFYWEWHHQEKKKSMEVTVHRQKMVSDNRKHFFFSGSGRNSRSRWALGTMWGALWRSGSSFICGESRPLFLGSHFDIGACGAGKQTQERSTQETVPFANRHSSLRTKHVIKCTGTRKINFSVLNEIRLWSIVLHYKRNSMHFPNCKNILHRVPLNGITVR